MSQELLSDLRAIVGNSNVLTSDDPGSDLNAWESDWRKLAQGRALAVVRPASTLQVSEIVRACSKHRVSLVPQGGNTGLVVGSTPDGSGRQVVLSLLAMNKVRRLDPANASITVDAGCVLQNVQDICEKEGLLFPLSLGAEGSCTIGGNLATNAGGTQVLRFGNARDLCLGLEVVTAEGEVWSDLSGLRKNNTGYDLRNLFIGSEGTLGIITGATLKTFPLPAATLTSFVAIASVEAAVELLKLANSRLGPSLTGFELMNQEGLSLVAKHYPQQRVPLWESSAYCVLMEASDHESEAHARTLFEQLLEQAFEDGLVTDAVIAESIGQSKALWHVRESISLAQADEGPNLKHDISLPISSIPRFVEEVDAALQQAFPGVRIINFGHLGDGNLHYNIQAATDDRDGMQLGEVRSEITEAVYEAVARFGGSFSAEHGVGALKLNEMERYKAPAALRLMGKLKAALDPQGLLNPGRVVPRSADFSA
ncbi:FAD-binding oxidoreductase [Variovorax sp. J22R115]|uniref:FAD-binding oxidoreductase n=1 Tax=Variovorax sp. J22R115 TaxID=3053509 RepID=UPI002574B838|nr:FAD-binding oxidoreductase [Variovorax sp. J22R115]MDM0047392.1 FAD-binding oxidoreductase [Variovorax sp. J22R115]